MQQSAQPPSFTFKGNQVHDMSNLQEMIDQQNVVQGLNQISDAPQVQVYHSKTEKRSQIGNATLQQVDAVQSSNLKSLNSSSIPRKIIHYENPRKYVNYYSGTQAYNQQSLNYSNSNQCSQCTNTCTCQGQVQISLNPSYRFKVTKEIDLKSSKLESEREYEVLLSRVKQLEEQHNIEVSRLKEEFATERHTYEKEQTRHQLDLLKTLYVEQSEIARPVKQQEVIQTHHEVKQDRNLDTERKLFEHEQQTIHIQSLEQKILKIKEGKRVYKNEAETLRKELLAKEMQIKQLELEVSVKSTSHFTNVNLNDIEIQNQFLIQELGRITEENDELKKSCKIIEKPVYVASVQNVTQVKEVPPYIEEKIIYIQDTDQLESFQKIISELQKEIVIMNQEKQKLIMQHAEEKAQMLDRITQITSLQKKESASILKEVVVQKVIDRTEITLKEEELIEQQKRISQLTLIISELEQDIQDLKIELSKYTKQYKMVKLPNSYKIESSVSLSESKYRIEQQSSRLHQNQNTVRIQEMDYQVNSSIRRPQYDISQLGTIKKTNNLESVIYNQRQHHTNNQEQQILAEHEISKMGIPKAFNMEHHVHAEKIQESDNQDEAQQSNYEAQQNHNEVQE